MASLINAPHQVNHLVYGTGWEASGAAGVDLLPGEVQDSLFREDGREQGSEGSFSRGEGQGRSQHHEEPEEEPEREDAERGDGLYLYRHLLHPGAPNVAWVGSNASTIYSPLTFSLQAEWLARLLEGQFLLPDTDEMEREIGEMRAWKRGIIPHRVDRGAALFFWQQHYHDELVRDFGEDPCRKQGRCLHEVYASYTPRDYEDLCSVTRKPSRPPLEEWAALVVPCIWTCGSWCGLLIVIAAVVAFVHLVTAGHV